MHICMFIHTYIHTVCMYTNLRLTLQSRGSPKLCGIQQDLSSVQFPPNVQLPPTTGGTYVCIRTHRLNCTNTIKCNIHRSGFKPGCVRNFHPKTASSLKICTNCTCMYVCMYVRMYVCSSTIYTLTLPQTTCSQYYSTYVLSRYNKLHSHSTKYLLHSHSFIFYYY